MNLLQKMTTTLTMSAILVVFTGCMGGVEDTHPSNSAATTAQTTDGSVNKEGTEKDDTSVDTSDDDASEAEIERQRELERLLRLERLAEIENARNIDLELEAERLAEAGITRQTGSEIVVVDTDLDTDTDVVDIVAQNPSLNQAAFAKETASFQFGHRSKLNVEIIGAPEDTDFDRWAMLHDGDDYRLFFFQQGSNNLLYQFAFNPEKGAYEFGFRSLFEIKIDGVPEDADTSNFAMLHDGEVYRLYMLSKTRQLLYQFGLNIETAQFEFGHKSIDTLPINGMPRDADLSRWGMLHDGSDFSIFVAQEDRNDALYQFGFNSETNAFEFAVITINLISLDLIPENSNTTSFAMLHDGVDYRFYYQTK